MARSQKIQQDPTRQGPNRKKASRALEKRLKKILQFTLRRFRSIPRKRTQKKDIVNNQVFYEYDISATQFAELRDNISTVSNEQLLESQDDPILPFWYYTAEIERPYRQGTIEEVAVINRLVDEAIQAGITAALIPLTKLNVEAVLNSRIFADAFIQQIEGSVASISKLAGDTATDMYGVINRGIQAGNSPRAIANEIIKRFEVAVSSADRIAVTEVNKAYNDAKINLGKAASEELGFRSAVLHISALIPTTRAWHASRHGNTYTYESQQSWWNQGANRINCHCTIQTVLVNPQGQPINKTLQDELKKEKVFFNQE